MEYRLARASELEACAKLLADSFFDYPYFQLYCDDEAQRYAFIRAIHRVSVRLSYKKGQLWVAVEDGTILACAQLEAPGQKGDNLCTYLSNGGLDVIKKGGICNAFGWLHMFEKTQSAWDFKKMPHWYLLALAVHKESKGRGIGSRMIQEKIIPMIRASDCGLLALITNSERNAHFYSKNGFQLQKYELMSFNGKPLGNWVYVQKFDLDLDSDTEKITQDQRINDYPGYLKSILC